jgi:hypothetical protein
LFDIDGIKAVIAQRNCGQHFHRQPLRVARCEQLSRMEDRGKGRIFRDVGEIELGSSRGSKRRRLP